MASVGDPGSPFAYIHLSYLEQFGVLSDVYYTKAVDVLMQALKQDGVCIIGIDDEEATIQKGGLAHALSGFSEQWGQDAMLSKQGSTETDGGYHTFPDKELYNVVLGERPHELVLLQSFQFLMRASRSVLGALAWGLRIHSTTFASLLEDVPLPHGTTSASMLSCFYYKEKMKKRGKGKAVESACPAHIDKGLVTILASNDPGLEVLSRSQWKHAPANLAENQILVITGQALAEATAGLFEAVQHRVANDEGQARLSLAFKCRPRQQAVFDRGPIAEANPTVPRKYSQFERLLPVAEYMANFDAQHTSVNKPGKKRDSPGVYSLDDAASSNPNKKGKKEPYLTVTLVGSDSTLDVPKCRPSTRVKALVDAWAAHVHLDPSEFRLIYVLDRLAPHSTLQDNGIEDGDKIDVRAPQCGD